MFVDPPERAVNPGDKVLRFVLACVDSFSAPERRLPASACKYVSEAIHEKAA